MSAETGDPCHEVRVELPALVAGELDQTARAAVEAHLSFCPGCQFEWHEHELVWRCLGWSGDVEPPSDLQTRVLEAIRAHETKHVCRRDVLSNPSVVLPGVPVFGKLVTVQDEQTFSALDSLDTGSTGVLKE